MTAQHPSTPPPPPVTFAASESCKKEFGRDAPWKRLCMACWRTETQRRRAQAAPSQTVAWTPDLQTERDRLAVEVADLRALVATLTRQRNESIEKAEAAAMHLSVVRAELLRLRASMRAAAPALDADLIGRLIRLCHPDRHPDGRQAEATAATQALLQMRDRLQGGA